jgi:hypothetical protein
MHNDRDAIQASSDEPPAVDIHAMRVSQPASR